MRIGHSDWSKSSAYDLIFTTLGGEYNISELGYHARHLCHLGK